MNRSISLVTVLSLIMALLLILWVLRQNGAKAGFKAKTTINRFDYNLKWDAATETRGLVVAKDVDIFLNMELN